MTSIQTIKRSLKKQHLQEVYSKNNRVINPTLYHKLKQTKKCGECGRTRDGKKRFEIHHKVSIKNGGKNTEDNLVAVCRMCHKKLDNI